MHNAQALTGSRGTNVNWFDGTYIKVNGLEVVSGFPAFCIVIAILFAAFWTLGGAIDTLVRFVKRRAR